MILQCYTGPVKNNKEGISVPFCTHAGSGLSGTPGTIEDICPDASVGEGLAIRGSTAQNDRDSAAQSVESWLADGGYID